MLRLIFIVCIGGTIGSKLRYVIGVLFSKHEHHSFPFATFTVNLVGCFLIRVFYALSEAMFTDAGKRRFDMVLFWSLDRFSREGTRATIRYMEQLESYGVSFKSYSEQYIDSCGIFKDVIISLLSTLAKQEKIRISERVKAGLARSKKKGGRPKVDSQLVDQIKALKAAGHSNRRIADQFKISHSTVGLYI